MSESETIADLQIKLNEAGEEIKKLLEENEKLSEEKERLHIAVEELSRKLHKDLLKTVMEELIKKDLTVMSFQNKESGKQVVVRMTKL
jgi:predicted transcriptional regulator